MIQDRLNKIEARLHAEPGIPEGTREQLLNLVSDLKSEIVTLARTHSEDASSITGFTEASTHEATRSEKKPQLLQASLQGLRASVEDFETTHPDLAQAVNRIAVILSNMGI